MRKRLIEKIEMLGFTMITGAEIDFDEIQQIVVVDEANKIIGMEEKTIYLLDCKRMEWETYLRECFENIDNKFCMCLIGSSKDNKDKIIQFIHSLDLDNADVFISEQTDMFDVYTKISMMLDGLLNIDKIIYKCRNINFEILNESTIEGICNVLAKELNNTVIILSEYFEIKQIAPLYQDVYNEFYRWEKIIDKIVEDIKKAVKLEYYGFIDIDQIRTAYSAFLIMGKECTEIKGCFIVISNKRMFKNLDFSIIRGLIPSLYFKLTHNSLNMEFSGNYVMSFINNVLFQHAKDVEKMKESCIAIGMDYHLFHICFIFEFPKLRQQSEYNKNEELKKIMGYIRQQMKDVVIGELFLMIFENKIIGFQTYSIELPRISVIAKHEDFFAIFIEQIEEEFNTDCYIGISETGKGINMLTDNYLQAMEALIYGRKIRSNRKVYSYHEEYLFHCLYDKFSEKEIKEIIKNILEPIIEEDKLQNNNDLKNTLEAYIKCNGNLTQTAKMLFIHRNTLNYRMDKIKSLLSIKSISADDFTRYMVALTLMKLI